MISVTIRDELRSIVGEAWFLDSPEDLATYSYDAFLEEFDPDAVVVPGSTEEISGILRVANREGVNIIPRGAGTNLSGNSVARKGGLIMAASAASESKLFGTEMIRRFTDTFLEIQGMYGQVENSKWALYRGSMVELYQNLTGYTIAAGSSEIQRNLIAWVGLGLPRFK